MYCSHKALLSMCFHFASLPHVYLVFFYSTAFFLLFLNIIFSSSLMHNQSCFCSVSEGFFNFIYDPKHVFAFDVLHTDGFILFLQEIDLLYLFFILFLVSSTTNRTCIDTKR